MSKIAISNLAWNYTEDESVFEIMKEQEVNRLEFCPFRESGAFNATNLPTVDSLRETMHKHSISIVSMQSLLYNHPELTIFDSNLTREKTLDHLIKVIYFASEIGSKTLVFGSPKNRIKGSMANNRAISIAIDFFGRIAEICQKMNIVFCIEPMPVDYGADFIINTTEAVDLVKKINIKSFKMNLDLGSLILNREDPEEVIYESIEHAGHLHISEPFLKIVRRDYLFHKKISDTIKKSSYSGNLSIEMLPSKSENLNTISKTLSFIKEIYG